MKNALPYITAGLVILCMFLVMRSCGGPDPAYWVKKADYERALKDAEAHHQLDIDKIKAAQATIAKNDAIIISFQATIRELRLTIQAAESSNQILKTESDALRTEVQPALDANPRLARYVFTLTEQIKNLDAITLNLNAIIAEKDKQLVAWGGKFNAQVEISATWEAAYNREHGLRLSCDALRADLERQVKSAGKWKWIGLVGTVAGFVLGGVASK